ncbi:transcriptional regulator, LacI family [Celeribacter marinus]|uniref:Transcriptional regulator, LacI family n=1 Tax=Celeribacter marinus TaxID=1397108 RepID=A0A0P0ADJ5_9RHOB|nr:transcriptional regulator, LacI family [Celeribacter marinus]
MAARKNARPKLKDVARIAGVGTATVDRVLNERGNVSEEVRKKVIEAAREIGLRRQLPPSYKRLIRINLILARPELPLLQRMADEFLKATNALDHRVSLHLTTLPDETPKTIGAALRATQCDAVVVYAQDNPIIHDAIEALDARGIPVITIISDLPGSKRLAYAGTDHHAAGRTAGFFFARMIPKSGTVVILCNHLGFKSHVQRITGFREYLEVHAPDISISHVVEGLDDRVRARARLEAAFRDIPDTLGIYNVGAANLAVRAAIETNILLKPPLFVGHELTEYTTRMLRDGLMTLTLDQSPRLQAQFSLDVLLDHFGYESITIPRPYVSNVPIVLYGPENIPADH